MPGTVGVAGYEPVEVDLWGKLFETLPLTRSVEAKGEGLVDKLNASTNANEIVDTMGEMLDIRLKPIEGTQKASTLVRKKWKADEVTVAQITKLMDDIREADRPT